MSQLICLAGQLISLLDPAIHVPGQRGHCHPVHDGICDLMEGEGGREGGRERGGGRGGGRGEGGREGGGREGGRGEGGRGEGGRGEGGRERQ